MSAPNPTDSPTLPSFRQLRARFGLTPQEARVARLLALGESNRAIARRLRIRPATARHHTEAVLDKLDIRSRAAVAAAILGLKR